jgi:multiple sugar transport system ATP-binding protein
MATVSLKDVNKSFGAVNVIKNIDLEIAEGEFVVLIGPSGCGKSTLLRMIAGLEAITSGELLIDGTRMNDVSPRERGISMVFQSYALYPHMTCAQNMAFSLKLSGASKEEMAEKVGRAARVLGLEPYLDRYPRQLSGGQRQRVAMGRALVREPSVFLFDEPLSNLDAKLRVKMRAELKELHQKLRTTTIYVTHDQIEAMTLADRIVVLRDGRIEQIGSPLELYDNPANAFVGTFLGSPSMNLFTADLSAADPVLLRLADGDEIRTARPSGLEGRVSVGIRPESFQLVDRGAQNAFSAEVVVVEPTGSMTEVVLRKGKQDFVATFADRIDLSPGQSISVAVAPDSVKVFEFQASDHGGT